MDSEFSLFSLGAASAVDALPQASSRISRELALLAFANISGIGHVTAVRLYDSKHFVSVFNASLNEVAWIAGLAHVQSPHAFAELFISQRERSLDLAEVDLQGYMSSGVSIVFDDSPDYPQRLLPLADRPRWLFVRGSVDLLSDERLITVVGTRQPSKSGRDLAERVAHILVRQGFALVSGLAEGIDEIVHRVCVENKAQTVAVLGTGILNEFPAATAYLRNKILQLGGAIITEYFDKEQYSKQRFVQRNRVQAALSSATIPVEANVPSGTLHTVRFAQKYGRRLIGVKWGADEMTALHEVILSRGGEVVPVPASDDPFLEAIGRTYNYSDFARVSALRRRNAKIERTIKHVRAVIDSERLSAHEVERMLREMRTESSR